MFNYYYQPYENHSCVDLSRSGILIIHIDTKLHYIEIGRDFLISVKTKCKPSSANQINGSEADPTRRNNMSIFTARIFMTKS